MRPYELMVLLDGDLSQDEINEQLETIEGWIENTDGSIENADHWGRRRMEYEINDQREAYYVVYTLNMPSSAPPEVERNLRITESVLRYLITRTDE